MASMADAQQVRLEVLKLVVPAASRHQLTNPQEVVKIASVLEDYVLGGGSKPASEPAADPPRRKRGRPPKSASNAGSILE